jgi:hypothetical protein
MQIIITGATLPHDPADYGVPTCTLRFPFWGCAYCFLVYNEPPRLAVIYMYISHWRLFQRVRMWLYQDEFKFGPNRNITIVL